MEIRNPTVIVGSSAKEGHPEEEEANGNPSDQREFERKAVD